MRNKGFTLIELMVAIVIILIIGVFVRIMVIPLITGNKNITITNGQIITQPKTKDNYDKSYEDQIEEINYEAIVYIDGKEVKRYDVKRYTRTNEGYTLYLRYEDKKVQVPASTIIEEK